MGDDCRSLMARYQAGETQAFELLYGRLAPELPALVRALAPGVVPDQAFIEETFLHIHDARRSYNPRKPFEPWLAAIVRHAAARRSAHRRHLIAEVRRWFRAAPTGN